MVLEPEPYRRLAYTWHTFTPDWAEANGFSAEFLTQVAAEPRSKVAFDIEPLGTMVKLTVVHDNFEPGSTVLESVRNGWPAILSNLKTLLETGDILPTSPEPEPARAGDELTAMTSITLAVDVDADPARVFEILTTSEGQRGLWTGDCDRTDVLSRALERDVGANDNRLARRKSLMSLRRRTILAAVCQLRSARGGPTGGKQGRRWEMVASARWSARAAH